MAIARTYYFDGLHSYDIIATMNRVHGAYVRGEVSDSRRDHIFMLCSQMRWGDQWDYDQAVASAWPDPFRRSHEYNCSDWWLCFGVEAAMSDWDDDELTGINIIANMADDFREGGRFNPIALELDERSTAATEDMTMSTGLGTQEEE